MEYKSLGKGEEEKKGEKGEGKEKRTSVHTTLKRAPKRSETHAKH
jgi:hypothetical protein